MKFFLPIFLVFSASTIFSQEKQLLSPIIAVDSLYREDQFYLGLTYNSLFNKTSGITQNKFSSGITFGFLRDMPINKSRTVALGLGLGLSYNKCSQNLLLSETNQTISYTTIVSGVDYSKNKLDQYYLDVPLEFRWRTSTPENHRFWRIYSGFKMSYLLWDNYVHIDSDTNYKISKNDDLNKIQLGTYIAFGYNTWNFYAYYGLTPFFKSSAKINNESLGLNTLNIGLMFYIL